eukprot:CAMPEP_0119561336 /NCGR_PEP_ID=MMETSP1352-20130426/17277_1 /TAXON_ID=265584 /ORGANISM="Stauroneis constricta, Strain CCMP1120" /LENGTH=176 /DNA_ID=CAMNT_0007609513 /DNA_START=44 /DNA_END=574 /DNA_ORIENTATION=+
MEDDEAKEKIATMKHGEEAEHVGDEVLSRSQDEQVQPPLQQQQQQQQDEAANENIAAATAANDEIALDENGNPDPEQFINRGLQRWEAARAKWIESKNMSSVAASSDGTSSTDTTPQQMFSAVPLEVDDVIDVIFAPRWRHPGAHEGPPECFPRPVPLPQMVDILVDLWEAEGLDV